MLSEIDLQVNAQHRQATLLAEAARRPARAGHDRPSEAQPAATRLQTLLRRLAGAPTYA